MQYSEIIKNQDGTYTKVPNTASTLSVKVGDVTLTYTASEILELGNGELITNFVRVSEDRVEKVLIGKGTAYITKADEIVNLQYIAKSYLRDKDKDGIKESVFSYGEFDVFVLANDIEMLGAPASTYDCSGIWGLTNSGYEGWGFTGTLDGNGYSLINLESRLFYYCGKDAVIKNLGITTTITNGSVIAGRFLGTIENCYIDVKISAYATEEFSIISQHLFNSNAVVPKIRNTVIKVENLSNVTVYGLPNHSGRKQRCHLRIRKTVITSLGISKSLTYLLVSKYILLYSRI